MSTLIDIVRTPEVMSTEHIYDSHIKRFMMDFSESSDSLHNQIVKGTALLALRDTNTNFYNPLFLIAESCAEEVRVEGGDIHTHFSASTHANFILLPSLDCKDRSNPEKLTTQVFWDGSKREIKRFLSNAEPLPQPYGWTQQTGKHFRYHPASIFIGGFPLLGAVLRSHLAQQLSESSKAYMSRPRPSVLEYSS